MKANDPYILSLIKITDDKGNIIPWEYNLFPDQQVQVKIPKSAFPSYSWEVKASLPNPIILDLFNQIMYTLHPAKATINYLYGARCDKDSSGDYIVCNVAVKQVEWDAHNRETKYLAPHCDELIKHENVIYYVPDCVNLDDYDFIIFPDESAHRRYEEYTTVLEGRQFTICEKHRDQESGKIISHNIPNLPENAKKVILLDDLVDGGASFISIANTLPDDVKADLFVFHGVFSNNGLERLAERFNTIFVSNSLPNYKDSEKLIKDFDKRVVVFDVWN